MGFKNCHRMNFKFSVAKRYRRWKKNWLKNLTSNQLKSCLEQTVPISVWSVYIGFGVLNKCCILWILFRLAAVNSESKITSLIFDVEEYVLTNFSTHSWFYHDSTQRHNNTLELLQNNIQNSWVNSRRSSVITPRGTFDVLQQCCQCEFN